MNMMTKITRAYRTLSDSDIKELVPSGYAIGPSNNPRLNTKKVVSILRNAGFAPVDMSVKKLKVIRHNSKTPFIIRFVREQDLISTNDRTEVVVFYDPDPKNNVLYHLFAGYTKLVSEQSMMMGGDFHQTVFQDDDPDTQLELRIKYIIKKLPELELIINQMKKHDLRHKETVTFAAQAVVLRWKEMPDGAPELPNGVYATRQTLDEALLIRRNEERYDTNWNVYCRIHEAVIGGNVHILSVTAAHPDGRIRDARPLIDVELVVDLNIRMWELAMSFAVK